ncbi:RnfABCDGE type electron transport complex subunit D [Microcoleus sp. FACHB-SPT15]|uniref:RnfABCDGE type electron transport complex subunit D n=1 Tax=Microcoleus sp. FACHB-SPT15 TaxID=2692830 RepID=UPI001781E65F|nr:RnfABCDGE type electron transport complex subunit D [Microcoleus sp. FACHB-SPT15]MBD1809777.1 RnfABCDGE type electron transport complex subunit D [Microcoleus sp. FACHB-SPT15]
MLRQDPRNYQILFLSLFLFLGIATRDWTLRPDLIVVVIVTCVLTQWLAISVLENSQGKRLNLLTKKSELFDKSNSDFAIFSKMPSLKSAMITALGLSLLLRADHYTTMILAGSLAILSKFLFQVERKHFFNPANFGIIAALILTNDAWVSPGQWGDDGWYALLFLGTGGMVLKRVGRWDTTAAFLGTYALLEAIRNLWLGWTWDVYCHRLMSGSLLLFALFMITDPRSIPKARIGRLVWAGCIAILSFILRNYFFVSSGVFWALFALSPLSVLLDVIWFAPQFSWLSAVSNADSRSIEVATERESEQYSRA